MHLSGVVWAFGLDEFLLDGASGFDAARLEPTAGFAWLPWCPPRGFPASVLHTASAKTPRLHLGCYQEVHLEFMRVTPVMGLETAVTICERCAQTRLWQRLLCAEPSLRRCHQPQVAQGHMSHQRLASAWGKTSGPAKPLEWACLVRPQPIGNAAPCDPKRAGRKNRSSADIERTPTSHKACLLLSFLSSATCQWDVLCYRSAVTKHRLR